MNIGNLDSNKRIRTGYSTPDRKSLANSYISTCVEDKSSESCHNNTFNMFSWNKTEELKYSPLNHRSFASMRKKEQKLRKRKLLKQVLSKMILCKYYQNKDSFDKIRRLPQRLNALSQIEQHNMSNLLQKISQKIIFKAPITAQTSLIRSILNLRKQKKNQQQISDKRENNRRQINLEKITLYSATIYPTQQNSQLKMERKAILILQQFSKQKIKTILRCFRNQALKYNLIKGYFYKVINNFKQNRRYFVRKLRVITKIQRQSIMNAKRKCLQLALNKCIQRRDKIVVQNLKAIHLTSQINRLVFLELIHKKSENIKLKAFFAIYKYSSKNTLKNPEDLSQSHGSRKIFRRKNNVENPHVKNLRMKIQSLRKRKDQIL